MMIQKAALATMVSLAALLAIAPTQTFAEKGGSEAGVVGKLWQGIKERSDKIKDGIKERSDEVKDGINEKSDEVKDGIKEKSRKIIDDAMRAYESMPRQGSCEERRTRILAALPDALRFAQLARNIYSGKHEARMRSASLSTLDLGSGRMAHFESSGRRYAEVHIDEERRHAVVVFRGTRLTVHSDISADVTNFVGLPTAYYGWAAALVARVVREHRGMQVIATGHSLGGGLAIFAVLRNPGVKGFAFNPAGLAKLTWAKTSRPVRARTNAALTAVSTRNGQYVEPVTAISLARGSVLPGHVFVVGSDALDPVALHSAAAVVRALERVEASKAAGSVCDGDLGVLAN